MKRRQSSRSKRRRIATASINRLLREASAVVAEHPERASRYVFLARESGMRSKIPISAEWKRMICRDCNAFLVPGRTSRVRLRKSRVNITCMKCGKVHRYRYGPRPI